MTPQQIRLVQESFRSVAPMGDQVAEIFYARLFQLDPSLRPMFSGDMQEQGRKLITMIGFAVQGLSQLHDIVPQVMQLGRRHAGYGVQPDHYDTVAEALLWTLEQGLGDQFTDELRGAWTEAYLILARTMMAGARELAA